MILPGFEQWIGRVLAFLMLAGGAFGAAPANAHVCDRYDDARLARDLAAMKSEIGLQLPLRYSGLIARLEFRTADPDEEGPLLPGAIDSGGDHPSIEIPANYYRLHCLMTAWTHTLLAMPQDRSAPPLHAAFRANRNCVRVERAGTLTCLRRALETSLAGAIALPADYEATLDLEINTSLFFIIAHEIAHIALSHRYSGSLDRSVVNEELAADVFALQLGLPGQRDYTAVMYQLMPADFFGAAGGGTSPGSSVHPLSSCRLSLAHLVANRLGPEIAVAMRWGSPTAEERAQAATSSLAAQADSERLTFGQMGSDQRRRQQECGLPTAEVEAMQARYRALLVAIDRAVQAAGGDDAVLLARLSQFRADTIDVRQLFDLLLIYRLDDALRRAHERRDMAAARPVYKIMIDVAERLRPSDLPVFANFIRSMDLGIERFRYAPPGSNTDRVISRAEADLHDAERYLRDVAVVQNWPNIEYHLGLFALGRGNCAEAARRFARLRTIANPTYAAQADPYRSLDRASPAQCATETRRLRDHWREFHGWQ